MPRRPSPSPFVALLVALYVAGPAVMAASAQESSRRLSLEEAIRLFARNNLELRAARADARVEAGLARQAAAYPNPQLSVSHEPLFRDGGNYSESYLTLGQRFEWPSHRGARIEAAQRLSDAASMRVSADSARLAFEVGRLYVEAAAQRDRVALWRGAAATAAAVARSMAASRAEGETSGYDERRMRLELARYEVALSEAELDLIEAERTLALQVLPEGDALRLAPTDSFRAVPERPALGDLLAAARAGRPELVAARLDAEASAAAVRFARTARIPSPSLSAGYKRQSDGFDGFFVGMAVALPVFDRNQGEILARMERSTASDMRADLVTRAVENDVRLAHARFASLVDRQAILAGRMVEEAGEILDIARIGYGEGELRLLDVLDALDVETRARLLKMELLAALWVAHFDLRRAVGLPITL